MQAYSDWEAGNKIKAIEEIKAIADTLIQTTSDCKPSSMEDDIEALEKWATVFSEPKKLAEIIGAHLVLGHKILGEKISALKSDWKNKKFEAAGQELAYIITLAIGPVTSNGNDVLSGCWK